MTYATRVVHPYKKLTLTEELWSIAVPVSNASKQEKLLSTIRWVGIQAYKHAYRSTLVLEVLMRLS